MNTNPDELTEATVLLERDRQCRLQSFAQEVQVLQRQYRCELRSIPELTPDGRIVARIDVVAV